MPKQYLENKLGNKIKYDPDGKKYRYSVDEDPKSSVTTRINKRTRPDLQNWYKKNRYDAIKEIIKKGNCTINGKRGTGHNLIVEHIKSLEFGNHIKFKKDKQLKIYSWSGNVKN